ncbi:MAG: CopD family protein [Gammaproteobacteria bacterium]
MSAVIWVGGMFFAYVVLRPAAVKLLDPPQRLSLWSEVFQRFFPWVWVAIVLLLGSGNWMIFGFYGGMRQAGLHIHLMNGMAWIMIALFIYINLWPVKSLKSAVTQQDWPVGGKQLARIRQVIAINLSLGLAIVIIASAGRFLLG